MKSYNKELFSITTQAPSHDGLALLLTCPSLYAMAVCHNCYILLYIISVNNNGMCYKPLIDTICKYVHSYT